MNLMYYLYRALKIVATKDSCPFRAQSFEDYLQRHWFARFVKSIFDISPRMIRLIMVMAYAKIYFLKLSPVKAFHKNIAIYFYKNEKRALDKIEELTTERFLFLSFGWENYFSPKNSFLWFKVVFQFRFWKVLYQIVTKHNFLVSCRMAETFVTYLKFDLEFTSFDVKNIFISSDSNPYAMGLAFAGKKHKANIIYTNHGHIPEGPPRLWFDFSILDGQALYDVYKRSRGGSSKVLFKGVEGISAPLRLKGLQKDRPIVGLFLSFLTDWEVLRNTIHEINSKINPEKIILRLHPNEVFRNSPQEAMLSTISNLEVSYANQVASVDAHACDWVIAGNCSVHLTVLKAGTPSIQIKGIDPIKEDLYQFNKLGVVPVVEDIEKIKELSEFFEKEWEKSFSYFNPTPDNLKEGLKDIF